MKERPILFSGPMVRAVLDGKKTQTRRVVKPEVTTAMALGHIESEWEACPYARQPGERLWVRETWALEDCGADGKRVIWQADRAAAWVMPGDKLGEVFYLPSDYHPPRWRPSIHMPRWASRLTLEVTEVRVQRLQDISEEDARAEGVEAAPFCKVGRPPGMEHIEAFEDLWQAINGERPGCSWEANPWVWAVTFQRTGSL